MEIVSNALISHGRARVMRFVCNRLRENAYVIFPCERPADNSPREAVLIDCGAFRPMEKDAISDFVKRENLQLKFHLLTHGHFDHLWGAQWALDTFNVNPTLPYSDLSLYQSAEALMQRTLHRPDRTLPVPPHPALAGDGYEARTSALTLRYIAVPGHTHGSSAIYDREDGLLFTGDALFRDYETIATVSGFTLADARRSVEQRIRTLPQGTLCLPGHGPEFLL